MQQIKEKTTLTDKIQARKREIIQQRKKYRVLIEGNTELREEIVKLEVHPTFY